MNSSIPPIIGAKSKKGTPRGDGKGPKQIEWKDIQWEFDVKDQGLAQKYGNFSSPTIIKMVSKYNKAAVESGGVKAQAA